MPDVVYFLSKSLFTDDAKLFFQIRSLNDYVLLQQDIESLLMCGYICHLILNLQF